MKDFWEAMDDKFLDYNTLSGNEIEVNQVLHWEDQGFLQTMKERTFANKTTNKIKRPEQRFPSDEMILKTWLSMLPETMRDEWHKKPNRAAPLWPQFE